MLGALSRAFRSLLIQPAAAAGSQQIVPVQQRHTSHPRILVIRRKKMNKMKRRKRINRDWWQYQKRHLQKKNKAEALFRARMNQMLSEYKRFDPMVYVTDTIRKAKRDWKVDVAPTGRKKYPHWTTLMSLEELYGLDPAADYIDKRFGLPSQEERPVAAKLREDYRQHYWVEEPARMVAERWAQGMMGGRGGGMKRLEDGGREERDLLDEQKGTPAV